MISPAALFGISVVAGFVGAMSGMGGGIVLVPALTFLGLDIKHSPSRSVGVVLLVSWATLFVRHREAWRPVAHQDRLSRWLELEGSYLLVVLGALGIEMFVRGVLSP